MNTSFFMAPTVLMTEDGVSRYFNGKPKEIRGYLERLVMGSKGRIKVAAHRPHQEWFRAAFRDEVFCRAWFEKTRFPSRAYIGGLPRGAGVWEAVHGVTHFVGGVPRVLLNALRIIKGHLLVKAEAGLMRVDRSLFPQWVWDGYTAGDGSVSALLVYTMVVLDTVALDQRDKQEAAALAIWCMAGILGDDAMLKAGLKRWPAAQTYLEPVGSERPDVTPPALLATRLAKAVFSVATETAPAKEEADEVLTGLWKTNTALERMGRVLSNLVKNDEEDVRQGILAWMEADLDRRVSRLSLALGTPPTKWMDWVEQEKRERLNQVGRLVPWSYDRETIHTLGLALDEVSKRIEVSWANVAKCERRLKDLAVDPIRHAQQIGTAAQDLCEAKAAHDALLMQSKKEIGKAYEACAQELDHLLVWKQAACAAAHAQRAGPSEVPVQAEGVVESEGSEQRESAEMNALRDSLLRMQEQLEREREKKQSADLRVLELHAKLEAASQDKGFLTTDEIMARLTPDYSPTPEAALAVAVMMRPALTALPSAWKSARKLAHFSRGAKLLRMLLLLGGEYAQALDRGEPDATARLMFGQDGYKANESDSILSRADCLRERTFEVDGESVLMDRHLAIGVKPDTRETLRVHFERVKGRFVIGHCGQHLSIPEKV